MNQKGARQLPRQPRKKPINEEVIELPAAFREQSALWSRALVHVLRGRRTDSDLTARQLGQLIGLSEDQVNKVERFNKHLSFVTALMWVVRTNMELGEFFEQFMSEVRQRTREKTREQSREQARRRRGS